MWIFPLLASAIALVFAAVLANRFARRRRAHQGLWAIALLMYAAASFALFLGVIGDWTPVEYRVFWLFGAVLNVPFLAQGEIDLLVRNRVVAGVLLLALVFGTAFAAARIRIATLDPAALASDLPSGSDAFDPDPFALTLARLYSFPAYFLLVGGTLWSAWRMRGRPELRDRFFGVLLVAVGATVVAGGSAFAATENFVGFSITLAAGVAVMFWGFLRASRPVVRLAHHP